MTEDERMTQGARRAFVFLALLSLFIAAASLLWTARQVDQSQHGWCDILVTIDNADQHGAKPATAYGRRLVADFHQLRAAYDCGK